MRRRESVKCEPLGFVADLPNQEYFDGQDLMIMLTMMAHGIPQIKRERERESHRLSVFFFFFRLQNVESVRLKQMILRCKINSTA